MKLFFQKSIAYLSAILLLGLAIYLLFRYTAMNMDAREVPYPVQNNVLFSIESLIFILFIFISIKICKAKKVRLWHIMLFFSLIHLITGVYLIIPAPLGLRADVQSIYKAALASNAGDTSDFQLGGYFFYYPHQLGLLSFFRLFGELLQPKLIFSLNLVAVLGLSFLQVGICKKLSFNETTCKICAVLSYCFLPLLFFILFGYNAIFSLFFAYLGIYFLVPIQETKLSHRVLAVFFLTIAVLLRVNSLILIIAILLPIGLFALPSKKIGLSIFCIALLLLPITGNTLLRKSYEKLAKQELTGFPTLTWVHMGLHTGRNQVPGSFSRQYFEEFQEYQFNKQEYAQVLAERTLQRIDEMQKNLPESGAFFTTKILNTWTNPLFQSLWSGPLPKSIRSQSIQDPLMAQLYADNTSLSQFVILFSRYILLLLYTGSAYTLWRLRKDEGLRNMLYIPLYFLGAFFFHLAWETKSQYVVGHVYMLIPLATYALQKLSQKANKIQNKKGQLS